MSAYEAHHAELFAFLARATMGRSVAEDLLQETFFRLARETREGRPPAELRGWLFRTATHLIIGKGRGRSTGLRWLGRFGSTERDEMVTPSHDLGVLGRERAAEMEQVLGGLSTDGRVALLLSGAGFSGAEIAAAIGKSADATRAVLYRARARVRIRRELFTTEPR